MTKIKRLLDSYIPNHYSLSLNLDEKGMSFDGTVVISGALTAASAEITLNAKGLTIMAAKAGENQLSFGEANDHHEITFTSSSELSEGELDLEISFQGAITDDMVGIYPSRFKENGEDKILLASQFEANHAREAFPCIDEPSAKATYELTLTTDTNSTVLSNTPIASQSQDGTRKTTTFEKTPRMSAYLLAFACGDIHNVERTSANGVQIGAWASTAQPAKLLDFAADEAVKILDFFEEYFSTPFPLPKLDMIALPDFDAGAMENWGLITYREIAMLADPDNRSVSNEQYVAMVVAHEISHMWFGNLVTMAWWDDLWLNESFASLMEHVALNAIHPEWNQWEHYASSDILTCTSRDIHKNIQPISVEVDDPELIETLFDPGIVYTKGGRLLKMLMEYIGEEDWRKGLATYFKKHAYQNTVRDDLWDAFSSASGQDVNQLMNAWLNQPGMPMLSVTQVGKELALSQKRFIVGGDTDESVWPIPLLAQPSLEVEVFDSTQQDITLPDSDYVVVNESASGHYLTYYTENSHRDFIATQLAKRKLKSAARINVLNDLILLSRNQILDYPEVLDAVAGMGDEDRYPVWALISRVIGTAQQLTEGDTATKRAIDTMRTSMAKDNFAELGINAKEGDSPNDEQLRTLLLSFMLAAEDPDATKQARTLLNEAKDPENLPSESRAVILSAMVRDGDTKLAQSLADAYADASSEMQLDIVHALSSTKDPSFARALLSDAVSEHGYVRSQDILRWIAVFLRNHHIREATWDHMVDNWEWLERTMLKSKSFDYLPTYCGSVISTPEMQKRFNHLFDPLKDNKLLKRNISIARDDIAARITWRQANEKLVAEWFASNFAD